MLVASPASFAVDLSFSPSPLIFGNVALGESKKLTATFKNSSTKGVHLNAIKIGGANAAEFSQANNCPKPVPAGKSCVFTVSFKPTVLTARNAALTLSTDDHAMPSVALPLSGNPYPGTLNDTGITLCGDYFYNGLPCPVEGVPRQDAETGRDKTHNSNADGHAGFSYAKLDASGNVLSATAKQWNCVRDNVTGLVWEAKPKPDGATGNQGLHDADDRYTWYGSDKANNGGNVGFFSGGACYGGVSCNTEAYIKRVNAAGWCGKKDWRLPTLFELRGLVDQSTPSHPAIVKSYFPDEQGVEHWSSSPYAFSPDSAWLVNFGDGMSSGLPRSNTYAVRLVRGGQ
jgi:hypothetical protein